MIQKITPKKTTSNQTLNQKISLKPKNSTINFLLAFASAYQCDIFEKNGVACDFILN